VTDLVSVAAGHSYAGLILRESLWPAYGFERLG